MRFLKIVFNSAEIFDLFYFSASAQPAMKLLPRMLFKRCNRFHVCSASDEIVSALAQHAFGCPCKTCQIKKNNLNAGWTEIR
jgi:hypothetical protein